jgi:hypothetical protein
MLGTLAQFSWENSERSMSRNRGQNSYNLLSVYQRKSENRLKKKKQACQSPLWFQGHTAAAASRKWVTPCRTCHNSSLIHPQYPGGSIIVSPQKMGHLWHHSIKGQDGLCRWEERQGMAPVGREERRSLGERKWSPLINPLWSGSRGRGGPSSPSFMDSLVTRLRNHLLLLLLIVRLLITVIPQRKFLSGLLGLIHPGFHGAVLAQNSL